LATLLNNVISVLGALLNHVLRRRALRYAMVRDFATHRAGRFGCFLWRALPGSSGWDFSSRLSCWPIGFDPTTFSGPLLTFWSLAQYLLPLALLNCICGAQKDTGALRRMVRPVSVCAYARDGRGKLAQSRWRRGA